MIPQYIISPQNLNDLFQKVNEELIKLYDWLCVNKLSLNITKTIYSIFSPLAYTNENREITPMLNNIPIVIPCNSDLKNSAYNKLDCSVARNRKCIPRSP